MRTARLLIAAVLLAPFPTVAQVSTPDPAVRDGVGTVRWVNTRGSGLGVPGRERWLAAPFGPDTTLEADRSDGVRGSALLIGAGLAVALGGAAGPRLRDRPCT